jgi:hypothetical protein
MDVVPVGMAGAAEAGGVLTGRRLEVRRQPHASSGCRRALPHLARAGCPMSPARAPLSAPVGSSGPSGQSVYGGTTGERQGP